MLSKEIEITIPVSKVKDRMFFFDFEDPCQYEIAGHTLLVQPQNRLKLSPSMIDISFFT